VPNYYQITDTEDVHAFAARWLQETSWEMDGAALQCHLLYFNALRYVLRLPHKGETPAETLSDICKAIDCLGQLKAVVMESASKRFVPLL
jgi:hypothetical protein